MTPSSPRIPSSVHGDPGNGSYRVAMSCPVCFIVNRQKMDYSFGTKHWEMKSGQTLQDLARGNNKGQKILEKSS